MKFEFRPNGEVYWRSPKDQNVYIQVKKGMERIVKKLLKNRPSGGTFRVTELGRVLLNFKNQEEEMTVKNTINGMPDISAILKTI